MIRRRFSRVGVILAAALALAGCDNHVPEEIGLQDAKKKHYKEYHPHHTWGDGADPRIEERSHHENPPPKNHH